MQEFPRHGTILESRRWIAENRRNGVKCPVCDRRVKEYSRPINRAQALAITDMFLSAGTDWVNVRNLKSKIRGGTADKNNEISKLAHWGLVQQHPNVKRGGTWRVTTLGKKWVQGKVSVSDTVMLYQAELTGKGTKSVYLRDILSAGTASDFDLRKIMADITNVERIEAVSSRSNFNEDTLWRRDHRKTDPTTDSSAHTAIQEDSLFAAVTEGMERVEYSLSHEKFLGHETVSVAREWLKSVLGRGGFCPTCDRIAVYKNYPMKDSMARLLIEMYRHHGMSSVDVREFYLDGELVDRNNYVSKIAQRGLVVEDLTKYRKDGGKGGWYKLTDAGVEWIFNRSLTPATVRSFNYYEESGHSSRMVSIVEVMRDSAKWNYASLMSGMNINAGDVEEELFLV